MLILLKNNHFPHPRNTQENPAICAHCDQYVEYAEIGWIHSSRDHQIYQSVNDFAEQIITGITAEIDRRYGTE